MKKITIIGRFQLGDNVSDGQSIKTRIVKEELEKKFGVNQVDCIDTYGWKKNPIKLFNAAIRATAEYDDVILMTDAGGIKVFPWLLTLANRKRRCKLHYVVVGGWLVHVLKKRKFIADCLRKFDGIYVETNAMKTGLEELQFGNTHILKNCKPLTPLTEEQLENHAEEPYRLCMFSRIMREKGVEEAVNAVTSANTHYKRTVFCLDLYGQVDDNQTAWFEEKSASFPPEIRYCGVAPYDQSVEILKSYFALLFPTKFYTEGIPGTIIDAYAAGVPVISSEWENFLDIVDPDVTGIGYPFSQPEQLTEILIDLVSVPQKIQSMRKNCLIKAQEYLPENALGILWDRLFPEEKDKK